MNVLGRLLIAALFVVSGIWKITHFSTTAAYFVRVGMPVGEAAAVLAIVIELGGGLLLAIGWRQRWIALLLAVFVVVATGLAHRFWEVDPSRFFGEMNNFLKNLAIIGGLLILSARGKA
ncbi:MAG: putative oxidoreductase [Betaproteobacteria bacterium]|jgi:putative oxidoreductase|nr:putative oxidoreductase [Betaproteobacteria bacterium]